MSVAAIPDLGINVPSVSQIASQVASASASAQDPSTQYTVTYTPFTAIRHALGSLTCQQARVLVPLQRRSLRDGSSPRVLVIPSTDAPLTAFRKLIEFGVQSAPVVDRASNKVYGLLDLRDLVSLVVLMEEENLSHRAVVDAPRMSPEIAISVRDSVSVNPPTNTSPTSSSSSSSSSTFSSSSLSSTSLLSSSTVLPSAVAGPLSSAGVGAAGNQAASTIASQATSPAPRSTIYTTPNNSSLISMALNVQHAEYLPRRNSHGSVCLDGSQSPPTGHHTLPMVPLPLVPVPPVPPQPPTSPTLGPSSLSATAAASAAGATSGTAVSATLGTGGLQASGPPSPLIASSPLRARCGVGIAPPSSPARTRTLPGNVTLSSEAHFRTSSPSPLMHTSPIPSFHGARDAGAMYLGQVFSRFSANTRAVDHKPQDFSVRYLAARNRCVSAKPTDSLLEIVDILGGSNDTQRVLIFDANKDVVDIFTQSDILKVLAALFAKYVIPARMHERMDNIPKEVAELQPSIGELQAGTSPVLSVSAGQSMFKTLQLMSSNKISGVAVIDDSGRFIGNTSGADLKLYLQAPSSKKLHMNVLDFVGEVRRSSAVDFSPAVSVDSSASLLYVVAKLAATQMHRVFVVDKASQAPIAVVSVEDVVKLLHKGYPSRRTERTFHRAAAAATFTTPATRVRSLSGASLPSSGGVVPRRLSLGATTIPSAASSSLGSTPPVSPQAAERRFVGAESTTDADSEPSVSGSAGSPEPLSLA